MKSNTGKRVEGKVQEIAGTVKGAIGSIIGSARMEAEGRAEALSGKAKQGLAKAAERVRGGLEQVSGKAKQVVGSVIDDEQLKLEGIATEVKGNVRTASNQ